MISDYAHIIKGLPVMYLLVVVAMGVVIGAMFMDGIFGWRKAKERGEKLSVPVIDAANGAMMTQENITYWSKDSWQFDTNTGRYRLTHTNEKGQKLWGGFIANGIKTMYYDTDIDAFEVPESGYEHPADCDPATGNKKTS